MDTNQRRQENNLSQTNTFTKGMNTDVAYDFVSNDQYLFGKNIRIVNNAILCEEPDSNNVNGVVAPVPAGKGVKFIFKDVKDLRTDPETEKTETQKLWEGYGDKIVDRILAVKTVDNIGAIILKYKGTNQEPTKGLWRVFKAEKIQEKNDQNVLEDKIALTYVYVSTEKTDRDRFSIAINKETTDLTKLYIADGKHGIIIINLTEEDLSYYEGLTEDELSPNRMYPSKPPVFVAKITGTLQTSQVQYAYRLYKKYGVCSKMSPLTHKIQVISNSRQTDVGNEEDTQSSIGFRLRIDIAHRHTQLYDKLQLYRVSYIKYGEEPKCELIWDAKFDKSKTIGIDRHIETYISDIGLKPLEEYTVDEFNQLSGLTVIPQLIDYNQQYMFAADITDETVIKIRDIEVDQQNINVNNEEDIQRVKLNTQAYSANFYNKIRLYDSTLYSNCAEYDNINEVQNDIYYINKCTDMSLADNEYYNLGLTDQDRCTYVPGDLYHTIGGKGPVVTWRLIVRQSPIHNNVYNKKFVSDEKYRNTPDSDSDAHTNSRWHAAGIQWGYSEEFSDSQDRYNNYILDVPKVNTSDIQSYRTLQYNEATGKIETSTGTISNDTYYLRQHSIEVQDLSNSYDDIFTSSMFRSLHRGEVYRYGIVFYDNNGNKTDVNWIADIRIPTASEYPIVSYNETLYAVSDRLSRFSPTKTYTYSQIIETLASSGLIDESGARNSIDVQSLPSELNETKTYYVTNYGNVKLTVSEVPCLYANTLGLWFTVNLPNDIINEYNIQQYEIVRCKKPTEYSKILFQVATSRPLSQKQFTNDEGPETTYYPYYASPLLTTDPYQIGFRMSRGQGRDFASASEVNNYHRGTDNKKHQLDFLQLFSPEILCRREDTLDVLLGSNCKLQTSYFCRPSLQLEDYDFIFRCKHQYPTRQIGGDDTFENSAWQYVKEFKIGQDGIHSRCITYGQCLYGPPGEYHTYRSDNETGRIFRNIRPRNENIIINESDESPTYKISKIYMFPTIGVVRSPSRDPDEQRRWNLPVEWLSDSGTYQEFSRNYIFNTLGSGDAATRKYIDTVYKDYLRRVTKYGDEAWLPNDDVVGLTILSAPYLIVSGLLSNDLNGHISMYTPFPVINRAYLENDKDKKQGQCYMFKNYYIESDQDYTMNKWGSQYSPADRNGDETEYTKYQVLSNQIIDIDSISDVQNPLWEDGYDDVKLSSSIVDTAVKKYKTYLTSVGSKTYCNWSACGLYNWRAGQNDTVARVTKNYSDDPDGDYNRIQHFFNPAAEDAKGYHPGSKCWGFESYGDGKGSNLDYWTYPSKDLRWNNGWFGPGPVCFLAQLSDNLGRMDFEYGQYMTAGMSAPVKPGIADNLQDLKDLYYKNSNNVESGSSVYSYNNPTAYTHAHFSSFGTWVCNIIHTATNFAGMTKQEKFYDSYLSFGNIGDIRSGSQCVFDGDTYILPCEFTSCFKTYNNNAVSSTLNSQQFVYYIPMETKINVCFDYGKNYRNTVNPNLQLEEGDMEGVASQDRPLHQYNYIYSDNNNSIREYMASIDEDEITHIEHRIIYSEPKTNGEQIDSWNTFKAANFIDADSHYGKITYLFTVKDIIHFWQTRAFGRLTVNERSLVTDENQNQITLGTGGVVQRTDYISTNYGMKQYDMSAVNAESDVYWIDRTNNILAVYSQGRVGSIGELHNVQNLINHLIDQDNLPTIHYDINAKEIIAKFLHQIDNNVETIEQLIYNTRVNIATAVYTRDYDDILEFNNVLYGINIKEMEATQYNFLSKGDVSDYLHPARLSFLVNIAPDTTKVFDNQKIVTAKRKSYNSSDEQEYTKNYMLNKKYTFTTDIHDTEWNQFNGASEAITDREGNILYTIPRYGNDVKWGSRLNGKWMKVDLDMMLDYQVTDQSDQTETKYRLEDDKPISQIITKFRRSYV